VFDTRVVGKRAQALVRNYWEDINAEDRKVLIGFRLSDLYVETFDYGPSSPKAGQVGVSLKARLLSIHWIKVNGERVYIAPRETDAAETPPSPAVNVPV
jgi:hypothetical protein